MKKEIKGIVFDLGGVIINLRTVEFFRELGQILKIDNDEHFRTLFIKEAERIDNNKKNGMGFWREFCEKLNIDCPEDDKLLSIWPKLIGEVNEKTQAIVEKLHGKYPLAIISNSVPEHMESISGLDIYKYFDTVIFSTEVGLRKPDREIYKLAAQKLGIPLNQLLFIDDNPNWIKAAEDVGMQAVLFEDAGKLKVDLKSIGVLV